MTRHEQIQLQLGDITQCQVDAIVNAANTSLLGGGGVDGAIHRAAGPELLEECRSLGGCQTGEAKITGAYRLKAKHVIHTVGPVYRDGRRGEPELLASCYHHALTLARAFDCQTVAFPAISCGVYGYPMKEAALIALTTVQSLLKEHALPKTVFFVLFEDAALQVYADLLQKR